MDFTLIFCLKFIIIFSIIFWFLNEIKKMSLMERIHFLRINLYLAFLIIRTFKLLASIIRKWSPLIILYMVIFLLIFGL